jgi:hypothetical protein
MHYRDPKPVLFKRYAENTGNKRDKPPLKEKKKKPQIFPKRRKRTHLETTTTATSLAAGAVGGSGGNVLDTSNLHSGTSERTESRLGTGAGGLGSVTCGIESARLRGTTGKACWTRTTGGTDLDVEGSDANLLAAGSDVLGSQHGGVGRRLVTVGLDLHSSGNTGDGFPSTGRDHRSVSLYPL